MTNLSDPDVRPRSTPAARTSAFKLPGLRWWMISLIMLGSILNYLTRNTLSVAQVRLQDTLHITEQQYSWITGGVPGDDHAPADLRVCAGRGGAEDRRGDLRRRVVGDQHGARAGRLVARAGVSARPDGFCGGIGQSVGRESDGGVVPGAGTGTGRRDLQHRRVVRVDAGAAAGGGGDLPVQLADGVRHHRRPGAGVGGLWLLFYQSPSRHPWLSEKERDYIAAGQEKALSAGAKPSIRQIISQRNFWGIAIPRFLADPMWGTLSFWLPLYLNKVRGWDLKHIALFAWLPFLAADLGCIFGGAGQRRRAEIHGRLGGQCAADRVHARGIA